MIKLKIYLFIMNISIVYKIIVIIINNQLTSLKLNFFFNFNCSKFTISYN